MAKVRYANVEKTWQAVETQKRIRNIYIDLSEQASKELSSLPSITVSDSLRKAYLDGYIKELSQEIKKIDKEIQVAIERGMKTTAEAVVNIDIANMTKAGLNISGAWSHIPNQVVSELVSGKVYSGNWTLSRSLWKAGNKVTRDVQTVVAEGIARQKPTIEIAKDIEKYLNPAAKKEWDWSKVYPNTNLKVDYNAQRAARTLIQHSYQLSYRRTIKDNPFINGVIWHSAGTERTCELCEERDGQIFAVGSEPLDHPMGLCWLESHYTKSFKDISNDLADWVKGGDNKAIDKYVEKAYNTKNLAKVKQAVRTQSKYPIPSTLTNLHENITKYRQSSRFAPYLKNLEEYTSNNGLSATFLEDALKTTIDNNDLGMRVDSSILKMILNDGKFKNQMEVGESRGSFNPRMRKEVSHFLFGAESDKLAASEFEKYGYLVNRNFAQDLAEQKYEAAQYGSIIVKFKRDNIYNRTTFTMDDSLGPAWAGKIVGTPINNPSVESLPRYAFNPRTYRVAQDINSGKHITPHQFTEELGGRYIELQFHGQLTLDDVECVILQDKVMSKHFELEQLLKDKNIKTVVIDSKEVEKYL